jgi:hypothetical protein
VLEAARVAAVALAAHEGVTRTTRLASIAAADARYVAETARVTAFTLTLLEIKANAATATKVTTTRHVAETARVTAFTLTLLEIKANATGPPATTAKTTVPVMWRGRVASTVARHQRHAWDRHRERTVAGPITVTRTRTVATTAVEAHAAHATHAHAAHTCHTSISPRLGPLYLNPLAQQLHTGRETALHGRLRAECDKAEATAAVGLAVHHYAHVRQLTERAKVILQILRGCVSNKATHKHLQSASTTPSSSSAASSAAGEAHAHWAARETHAHAHAWACCVTATDCSLHVHSATIKHMLAS